MNAEEPRSGNFAIILFLAVLVAIVYAIVHYLKHVHDF